MKVGRFFMSEDRVNNVFYYKDIYLIDRKGDYSIEKYPIKLIITENEIELVHNRIHVKVVNKEEIKDNDKYKLNITPRQFNALSIPFDEDRFKVANDIILKVYSPKMKFNLLFDFKKEEKGLVSKSFFTDEIYDEGHDYFYKKKKKTEKDTHYEKHVFKDLKSFGVKKMYKRKNPTINKKQIKREIPIKRIFLEFMYDYLFMSVFQDSLPNKTIENLEYFFNKSTIIKGIGLKFRLYYYKNILNDIKKGDKKSKKYGVKEYKKLLESWRKLIISNAFESIDHKYYGKQQWFEDSEKEILRVHKVFLPLLK